MSNIDDGVKVEGVYGGVENNIDTTTQNNAASNLPVTRSFWSNMKAFWLQKVDLTQKVDWNREIKVELTPYQQKVENEVNDFLHQEVTWEKFRAFLTQPVTLK